MFMTLAQFLAILEKQKCSQCDKKATWLPHTKGTGYCDDHFPYHEEKLKEIEDINTIK